MLFFKFNTKIILNVLAIKSCSTHHCTSFTLTSFFAYYLASLSFQIVMFCCLLILQSYHVTEQTQSLCRWSYLDFVNNVQNKRLLLKICYLWK